MRCIFMPTGKLVRVSPDAMEKLEKARVKFETPSDCINRVLGRNPCKSETTEQTEDNSDLDESEPPTHEVA